MPQRSHARGEDERRRFVADADVIAALGLTFDQLSDPDVRSVVIRHEHPEFEQALKEGHRQIEGSDGPMNPRQHLKMHEIVATQLWDDSPPEVWDTAVRLRGAGYERDEILHMLARPVSDQVWAALHDELVAVHLPKTRPNHPKGGGAQDDERTLNPPNDVIP